VKISSIEAFGLEYSGWVAHSLGIVDSSVSSVSFVPL